MPRYKEDELWSEIHLSLSLSTPLFSWVIFAKLAYLFGAQAAYG